MTKARTSPEGVTLATSGVPAGDYAAQRVAYDEPGLRAADLASTPLAQFERWYAQAVAAQLPEPNAMVLATADGTGAPSARTVLLKQADPRGFVFYTNYGSRKAEQIGAQPRVALVFPWHALARQVAVQGVAERVPADETAAYFAVRPWESRIGAWASHQSRPLDSRADLELRWAALAMRWPDTGYPDDVPVPPHWGGFVVRPVEVEFWQGRPSRLHDRPVYVPRGEQNPNPALDDDSAWRVVWRQP